MLQGKLTSREKIMLYFLLCFFIVILGFYFGVKPARENCNQLQSDYESREQEYNMMLTIKNSYEERIATMQQQTKELEAINGKYFAGLDSADLDDITTTWITGSGLAPLSISIGDVTYGETIYPASPDTTAQYGVANVSTIALTWEGDLEALKPVLDRAASDGRFAVRTFVYTGGSRSQTVLNVQAICLVSVTGLEVASTETADIVAS